MATRHHGWCLTANNPADDYIVALEARLSPGDYAIVGREVAPTTGTVHYQGYIHWANAKTMARMRSLFPRTHLAVSLGTPEQNTRYCSKEDSTPYVYGVQPVQGERTDQDALRQLMLQGANMRQIAHVVPNAGALRLAENWMRMHEAPRDINRPPEVRWYHGTSGSGKTKAAMEWLGDDSYICLDKAKWWDGYDQHHGVLIDDFREKWCSFNRLLQLLDRYPVRLEVKGGTRQLRAMKIAITAPDKPEAYYRSNQEDKEQLLRRITQVIDMDNTCHFCGCTYGIDCNCQVPSEPMLIESSDDE